MPPWAWNLSWYYWFGPIITIFHKSPNQWKYCKNILQISSLCILQTELKLKETLGKFIITHQHIKYFLGFSRVVTLISLLVALKETYSPSSLHIHCEQGYIPYKNATRARPRANPFNNSGETEEVYNILIILKKSANRYTIHPFLEKNMYIIQNMLALNEWTLFSAKKHVN